MNKQHAFAVGIETNLAVERSQKRFVVWRDLRPGPHQRLLAAALLVGLSVRAATIVSVEPDAIIVILHDGRIAFPANTVGHLVGEGRVANKVSQAVRRVDMQTRDIREHGFECRKISVNVAENGDTHNCPTFAV